MSIVLKSGSLNLLEPSGPVQACNGIALPLRSFSISFVLSTFILTNHDFQTEKNEKSVITDYLSKHTMFRHNFSLVFSVIRHYCGLHAAFSALVVEDMCIPTYTQVFLLAYILGKTVWSFSSKHGSRTGNSGKVNSEPKTLPVGM